MPLSRQIDLPGAAGLVIPADINQDGVHELLVLQTPGLFHARIHNAPHHAGWDHFCLTAMTQDGRILWRVGKPWGMGEPYASHGGERSLCVFDLDGDGRVEIYVIRGDNVLGIAPDDGCVITRWPLPYDNFVVLCAAKVGPSPRDTRLLASPSNEGYAPHGHGGPTIMFDADGRTVFNRDVHGFGHDPIAFDVNEDGHDEWLVGYELLDRSGRQLWQFEPCASHLFDDTEMHVDGLSLHWDDDPAARRIAYAASIWLIVLNADGVLQWRRKLVHPQQTIFAQLLADRQHPQLFVLNKRDALQLFDFDGELLWTVMPEEHWPWGKPDGLDGSKFHQFDPCVRLERITGDGLDAICYAEGGWPYAVDGRGRRVLEFECPPDSRQGPFRSLRRPDDFGAGYVARRFVENDQQVLILSDRNHVWLFHL